MPQLWSILERAGIGDEMPVLVFWKRAITAADGDGWEWMEGHDCGGFAIYQFAGFVKIIQHRPDARDKLVSIANEEFCEAPYLAYGVEPEHRVAYAQFLASLGLAPGELSLLQQAVYPLAATVDTLRAFGSTDNVPAGASILVLGRNCD